jgi:hypothetical protein
MATTRAMIPATIRFLEFVGLIELLGSVEFVALINIFLFGEKERIRRNVRIP